MKGSLFGLVKEGIWLAAKGKVLFDADWLFLVIGGGELSCGFLAKHVLYILSLGHAGFPQKTAGFNFDLSFL